MVKPPPAKPSFSAAMGRIFLEALVSFTHSASASFNFFKGGYKGQALDYLAALIRLCEKVVGPIVKENSEFAGAGIILVSQCCFVGIGYSRCFSTRFNYFNYIITLYHIDIHIIYICICVCVCVFIFGRLNTH